MYFRHQVIISGHWNPDWVKWCQYHFGTQRYTDNAEGDWSFYRDTDHYKDGNVYDKHAPRKYVFKFRYKSDAVMFREYGKTVTKLDKRARTVAKEYFSGLPYWPNNEAKMMFKMAVQ